MQTLLSRAMTFFRPSCRRRSIVCPKVNGRVDQCFFAALRQVFCTVALSHSLLHANASSIVSEQLMTAGLRANGSVVVVDAGAGQVKAGCIGNDHQHGPTSVFPCLVGRAGSKPHSAGILAVGEECMHASGLTNSSPVSGGIVTSYPDMEAVWEHTFNGQLGINCDQSKVLLTQSALCPTCSRAKTLEILFERFGFAAASLQLQPTLTLYAQGCISGLVVDCGHSISSIVAVVEGVVFPHATKRVHIAGHHVSKQLLELLQARGYALSTSRDRHLVSAAKEKLCYVALDSQQEAKLARETTYLNQTYTLPDGQAICLGLERSQAAEVLFDPSLMGIEGPGIAQAAFEAIQEMDMTNRCCLYEHVVLTGGTSMLRGLPSRVEKEMRQLFLQRVLHGDSAGLARLRLRLSDPPNRKHLAWLGGAVLADMMQGREDFWISRQEYEEDPARALKKCC